MPTAGNPFYDRSDDGATPEDERKPESAELAAARAEVEALRKQLAIAQPDDPARASDDQERVFPKGTSVDEVHEFDFLERERALLQKGLDRLPKPEPEGAVTIPEAELRAAQSGGGVVTPPRIDPR